MCVYLKLLIHHQYWSISPVEHLLTRMEIDSPPVVRRIVELLFPSFLPLDQNPQEQVSRCLTLLESNASAARVFFLNAPRHLTLGDTGTVEPLISVHLTHLSEVLFVT